MSTLQTKSFTTIVGSIAAGMQARIPSRFLSFAIGTMLRGLSEAFAGPLLWMQFLALSIAKLTRAATSFGADLDSWIADFNIITRLPAQKATGLVTFSRLTPGPATIYVPVGSIVQTQDGTQVFTVYADTTNPSFIASAGAAGGYVIPAQVSSVIAPVQALVPGSAGNVAAGAINRYGGSGISGIDVVTNASPFTNAIDVEQDPAFLARFQLNILALGGGTEYAIKAAIANLRSGMQCSIAEGVDANGAADPGMVTVFVDDGSGAISQALKDASQAAVNAIRAAGVRIGVYPAVIQYVIAAMSITVKPGYYKPTVAAQVSAAVSLVINSTAQGATLPYFSIIPAVLAVPGMQEVTGFLLNGGTSDIVPSPGTTIKVKEVDIG